jgi:hypothetical protein
VRQWFTAAGANAAQTGAVMAAPDSPTPRWPTPAQASAANRRRRLAVLAVLIVANLLLMALLAPLEMGV